MQTPVTPPAWFEILLTSHGLLHLRQAILPQIHTCSYCIYHLFCKVMYLINRNIYWGLNSVLDKLYPSVFSLILFHKDIQTQEFCNLGNLWLKPPRSELWNCPPSLLDIQRLCPLNQSRFILTLAVAVGEVIMEGPWWEHCLCTPAAQEIYYKGDGHQAPGSPSLFLFFFFHFLFFTVLWVCADRVWVISKLLVL